MNPQESASESHQIFDFIKWAQKPLDFFDQQHQVWGDEKFLKEVLWTILDDDETCFLNHVFYHASSFHDKYVAASEEQKQFLVRQDLGRRDALITRLKWEIAQTCLPEQAIMELKKVLEFVEHSDWTNENDFHDCHELWKEAAAVIRDLPEVKDLRLWDNLPSEKWEKDLAEMNIKIV